MSMSASDVKFARNFLRISHKKKVYDSSTGEAKVVDDLYPITIEFDNNQAASEKNDIVMWDDANNLVLYFTTNSPVSIRGAQYAMGRDKVLNPALAFLIYYEDIQQLRMECNEEAFKLLTEKAIANNMVVNYNGKEVAVTSAAIENARRHLFDEVDPNKYIPKDDANYSNHTY